jgi:hypothetical protein
MKTHFSKNKVKNTLMVFILLFLTQGLVFCQNNLNNQNNPNPGQKTQDKTQPLPPEQTATIKTILSKYNASKLTAADAKAIHEKLREAGIHAGPETNDAIITAGFDPEKLRALDPPKNPDNQGRSDPPSTEERLKSLQEKVIKPLALNSTQNDAVTKAYTEFYAGMENLKKNRSDSQGPLDKSKVEPLEKARDEKIRKVLSSTQFSKYQELEKASRPPRPAGNETKKN